jgi:VWFA-related protein
MTTMKALMVIISLSVMWPVQSPASQPQDHTNHRSKNGPVQTKKVVNDQQNTIESSRAVTSDTPTMKPGAPIEEKSERAPDENGDQIKLSVDLVVLDAQVMQQKTARVVGDMKREDFVLYEDGVKQQITHFSQDTLPLSVILLIDRGGCLDPFGEKVRHATLEALNRLKPQDEVALMAFHDTCKLVSGFSRNKQRIRDALERIPPHEEEAEHCFNRAFYDAANYMKRAGNPDGRRVIIVITALTTALDCQGPSREQTRLAVLESGSVVCGIIPKSTGQRMESGAMRAITGIAGLFKASSTSIKQLAEETGGEVMSDKPEYLDRAFNDLVSHLRTRYSVGFVSTNTKRDGSFRKLKVEVSKEAQDSRGKLVVKTRRGYIAGREGQMKEVKSRAN